MTDIIERLKRGHQGSGIGPLDCHDAVQEIEQLRGSVGRTDHIKKAIAEALKIERELCAKMVERFYDVDFHGRADAIDVGKLVCLQLAEAIRNR